MAFVDLERVAGLGEGQQLPAIVEEEFVRTEEKEVAEAEVELPSATALAASSSPPSDDEEEEGEQGKTEEGAAAGAAGEEAKPGEEEAAKPKKRT